MAKNGYRIFDSDTHVGPVMEALSPFIDKDVLAKLPAYDEKKKVNVHVAGGYQGHTTYTIGERSYRRKLGNSEAYTDKTTLAGAPQIRTSPVGEKPKPSAEGQIDPAVRIREMDIEGIDVNFMLPSAWFGGFSSTDDVAFEMGMYRAYHRWMNDYCGAFPDRLGGLGVSSRDIAGSIEEIRRWKNARWPWGMLVYTAGGLALDHPDLEPLWAEAQEHDLVVALHTFTAYPPYAPGGLDTWGSRMLQTSCAHPWCGQRNIAALIGAGVMERYPRLRIGTLEAGHGWLPNWLLRLDEFHKTMRVALSDDATLKPSEYALSGRYFQSIDIFEGEKMTNVVADMLGDHVLMFGSDYPHGESYYPESVNQVMKWNMPQERKRKLFWDNAVKFYARSGHK